MGGVDLTGIYRQCSFKVYFMSHQLSVLKTVYTCVFLLFCHNMLQGSQHFMNKKFPEFSLIFP